MCPGVEGWGLSYPSLIPLELGASAHAGRFSLSRSSRELQTLSAGCFVIRENTGADALLRFEDVHP